MSVVKRLEKNQFYVLVANLESQKLQDLASHNMAYDIPAQVWFK